jgi:hypothetical protein
LGLGNSKENNDLLKNKNYQFAVRSKQISGKNILNQTVENSIVMLNKSKLIKNY